MASHLHDALLQLFRNRPELASELLRDALGAPLPEHTDVQVKEAELSELRTTEYRADLVLLLSDGKPVQGIVVEVQLRRDGRKEYSWPVYATNLRARIRCPVCLLVISPTERVAKWAGRPIDLGGGNVFRPLVLGPSRVPIVGVDERVCRDPELAVLSAVAHGRAANPKSAVHVALAAIRAIGGLDDERAALYFDLIQLSLGEAARKELQAMEPANYQFQSDFARRYFSKGKHEGREEGRQEGLAEGETRGEAKVVRRLLEQRFGALPPATLARLESASVPELDQVAERLLTAETLDAVFAGGVARKRARGSSNRPPR